VTTTSPDAYAGTAGDKIKNSSTTITYDLGMVKIGYGTDKTSFAYQNTSSKADAYSLSAPINASFSVFYSTTSATQTASGSTGKMKGSQYGARYALSKRTVAYFHANNSTSTTAANVATKVNGYGLGIHHSF
jgi:predicted porin